MRQVNFLVAKFQMEKENASLQDLLLILCLEMDVSEKVARELLRDRSTIFQETTLDEQLDYTVPCFEADPAKMYEQGLLTERIKTAFDELAPRERILIRQYLGLDGTHNDGMTFQGVAVMLNYNGHSAAEKAYKRSVDSLKNALYESKYGNYLRAKHALKWLLSN